MGRDCQVEQIKLEVHSMKSYMIIIGKIYIGIILIVCGLGLIYWSDGTGSEEVIALPVTILFMSGLGIIVTSTIDYDHQL